MTNVNWHVAEPVLARFAREPRRIDDVTAASIEAHLISCAQCRAAVRASAGDETLTMSWDAIADRIDRPRAAPFERAADRLGLPTATARLVGLTPALQLATLAAVAVLAAFAVLASRAADSAGPFLIVAPVVPLATVGLLATSVNDPAGEIGVTTAVHGFGLVLRRSVVTLVLTFAVLGVASIALPNVGAVALGWVLPGLALSITAVLLSSWVRPETAVAGLALGWVTALGVSVVVERNGAQVRDWPLFTGTGLIVWLALALVSVALLAARRDRFASLEVYR
jgi:hypothetical protein